MNQQELINQVRNLIKFPEVAGETTLEDWINEGDTDGMTAEEIAEEWDALSAAREEEKSE